MTNTSHATKAIVFFAGMRQNSNHMKVREWGLLTTAIVMMAVVMLVDMGTAAAQQAVSPSYSVDEVFFGTGGELDSSSNGYRAKMSAGETSVGNTVSPTYQTQAGFNTNREEYIEFVITNSGSDLGVLTAGVPATTTSAFTVKSYLAHGYVVHTVSDPPSNSGSSPHTMNALTTPTASNPNNEQFGINLVDNASPADVGFNPVQIPDSTFSFGAAATGYNTADVYKYVKGDIVAQSTKSSGQTNYTVTYMYNISTNTPAGEYIFRHHLVATSTY